MSLNDQKTPAHRTVKKNSALVFLILVVALTVYILSGIFIEPEIQGNIDFPCWTEIDEDGCLILTPQDYNRPEEWVNNDSDIRIYLSYYPAEYHGGGCALRASNISQLSVFDHSFLRDENRLLIDNNITLNQNEECEIIKILSYKNLYLTKKEKLSVKNYGIITCAIDYSENSGTYNSTEYGPTLVAIGSYETYWDGNINILIISLAACLLLFITGIFLYRRYNKEHES